MNRQVIIFALVFSMMFVAESAKNECIYRCMACLMIDDKYCQGVMPFPTGGHYCMKVCRHEIIEELKEAVIKTIGTLTQGNLQGTFQKLLQRYSKCISAGRDYFEGGKSFIFCGVFESSLPHGSIHGVINAMRDCRRQGAYVDKCVWKLMD